MRVGVVLGLVASGCSLVLVRTPAPLPPGEQPSCTSTRVAPAVDIVAAAGFGALAVGTYFAFDPGSDVDLRAVGAAALIALAVPFVVSAVYGVRATGTCRAQEAAFAQYQTEYQRQETGAKQHLGRAGEACWPDGSCDPGLACAAGRCDMQRDP